MQKRSFKDGKQFAWDATSIELAQTCLRKYYYSMIRCVKPRTQSVHLLFGGIYASALQHFYIFRFAGDEIDVALGKVVRQALVDSWDFDAGHPRVFDDPKKTRAALIRTIVWYVEQFGIESEDGLQTYQLQSGKPAVELSFTVELTDDILLCGHLDRVVTMGDHLYVMDQKAQPLTAKVLTLTGWREIGALHMGDLIATQSGEFVPVSALHPKGMTKVYRVFFNDKTHVDCAEDHLWNVATQFNSSFKTIPFTEILHKKPHIKYHVPLCSPIQHSEIELPLHPYLLGVLLGDGYLAGNSIQLSSTKTWLVDRVLELLPPGEKMKKASIYNNSWTISGGVTLSAIRKLGLYGHKSYTKFVPDIYMFSSPEQRRALLDGLLDTDGSWNGKHRIFDSNSLRLARAVCELTRSLGGTARYRDRGDTAWRVSLRLPDLPAGVGKRYITAIKQQENAETMCISVDHPSGLYITENHTVTHNTTGGTVGTYYFNQFSPHNQMSGYSFAGQAVLRAPIRGVIIDAAQIAVNFTRFERGITTRSKDQLLEWRESALDTIERARHASEVDKWPMNAASCGNYGGCPFRSICASAPQVRENYLKSDFVEHIWDPLEAR